MTEVTRKRGRGDAPTTHRCGVCGETYDVGEATWVGSFYYWTNGEVAYRKHCRERHAERYAPAPEAACHGMCMWVCATCGKQKPYRSTGRRHAGPEVRLLDRRFGLAYCDGSAYPKHKREFGTIGNARGPTIFFHEGTPNPEQPVQTDPTLKEFLPREKTVRKSARKQSGGAEDGERVERKARRPAPADSIRPKRTG